MRPVADMRRALRECESDDGRRRELRQLVKAGLLRALPRELRAAVGRLIAGPGGKVLSLGMPDHVPDADRLAGEIADAVAELPEASPLQSVRVVVVPAGWRRGWGERSRESARQRQAAAAQREAARPFRDRLSERLGGGSA